MIEWRRELLNPVKIIEDWFGYCPDHIRYEKGLKGDYQIIRQSKHDGTYVFSLELLGEVLNPIIKMESSCKGTNLDNVTRINYTVGDIWHSTVFGYVYLPCSKTQKYPGQLERMRMSVKCEYVREVLF